MITQDKINLKEKGSNLRLTFHRFPAAFFMFCPPFSCNLTCRVVARRVKLDVHPRSTLSRLSTTLYIKPTKGYTPEGTKSSEEQNDLSHGKEITS